MNRLRRAVAKSWQAVVARRAALTVTFDILIAAAYIALFIDFIHRPQHAHEHDIGPVPGLIILTVIVLTRMIMSTGGRSSSTAEGKDTKTP